MLIRMKPIPSVLDHLDRVEELLVSRRPAVFLDYDGTLTPIVERPELAVLSPDMREVIRSLSSRCPLAVVSGRDLADVRRLVGLEDVVYAGSHGFEIRLPHGEQRAPQVGTGFLDLLHRAESLLRDKLSSIPGALVERKKFSVAAHFRLVEPGRVREVEDAVEFARIELEGLRRTEGKKVFELQPDVDWHKGRAVLWLMDALNLAEDDFLPIYLGDDVTDEDAFEALQGRGLGIVVGERRLGPSRAAYALENVDQVARFLKELGRLMDQFRSS